MSLSNKFWKKQDLTDALEIEYDFASHFEDKSLVSFVLVFL